MPPVASVAAVSERHTKIIATLGPAVASADRVQALVAAGMDVARLNFSHGDHDLHRSMAKWVRDAAGEVGRNVALLQDIQGPKLRVGTFPGGAVTLMPGDEVSLSPERGESQAGEIPLGYERLIEDVHPGDRVRLADGLIELEVTGATDHGLIARVDGGGVLADNKGLAFPDSTLVVDCVTPKDEIDLEVGRELGVDYVAASFVRHGVDVETVSALTNEIPVIAKIELATAYANLDSILEMAAGVMVARGDLGVQLPLERIPLIQDDILARTNTAGKVSITATEMLESMTHSPRPTRAEVTDVATAVRAGTDAVMLSGETAVGEYPVETVRAMGRICTEVEEGTLSSRPAHSIAFVGDGNRVASAMAQAATDVAANLGIPTIVAFTETGNTARLISKYRPEARIIAFTPLPETRRRMALLWGVTALSFERRRNTDEEINAADQILRDAGLAVSGDRVVMVAGVPPNRRAATNLLKVHVVGELATTDPG